MEWLNRVIIHCFKASIPSSSLYSIHPFLQNHPVVDNIYSAARIESISSPEQQQPPLPSLLHKSFFNAQQTAGKFEKKFGLAYCNYCRYSMRNKTIQFSEDCLLFISKFRLTPCHCNQFLVGQGKE